MQVITQKQIERRQETERRIVRRVVRKLIEAGHELTVHNGGDGYEIPWTNKLSEVTAALFACDEEHLIVRKHGAAYRTSFVFFVYGNSGWDVITDYGCSLSPILDPITEWACSLEVR